MTSGMIAIVLAVIGCFLALCGICMYHGGILTGDMIEREVKRGKIEISDFSHKQINPNSYNVSIGDTVCIYRNITAIDLHDPDTYSDTQTFDIPDEGFMLRPGRAYLIPTKEVIGSDYYEPIITGRSSFGRLGNQVHQEAGFADIGYHGTLTMQIKVTYPTKIYRGDVIAQVYFLTPHGAIKNLYNGRYQHSAGPVSSKLGNSWKTRE